MQLTAKRLLAVLRGCKQPVQVYPGRIANRNVLDAQCPVRLRFGLFCEWDSVAETSGMTASGKVQEVKLREHALKEFGL